MRFIFLLVIGFFVFQSCSASKNILQSNNHEENLKKLDKVYGKCNNPHRQIGSDTQKKLCESKQRAAGPDGEVGDPLNIADIFSGGKNETIIASSAVNKYLWDASLKTLEGYPMKNIDFEGGYMETDWIYDENVSDQRCLIKAHILSLELISNGVNTKIVCQKYISDNWVQSKEDFTDQEKQLILQILKEANSLSKQIS